VWSDICALLEEPGRLKRELERRLDGSPTQEFTTSHLKESIAGLKRRMGRLIDAYGHGWLDKQDFQPRIGRVKERLSREEQALNKLRRNQTADDELRLLIGHFDTFAGHIRNGLADADFDTKRKLLRLLIQRIEVD
jgi:site-specific DNA recombinase